MRFPNLRIRIPASAQRNMTRVMSGAAFKSPNIVWFVLLAMGFVAGLLASEGFDSLIKWAKQRHEQEPKYTYFRRGEWFILDRLSNTLPAYQFSEIRRLCYEIGIDFDMVQEAWAEMERKDKRQGTNKLGELRERMTRVGYAIPSLN